MRQILLAHLDLGQVVMGLEYDATLAAATLLLLYVLLMSTNQPHLSPA